MNRIKITSKGQITLPKEVRDKLYIDTGAYLLLTIKDGKIILEPQRQEDDLSYVCEYAAAYGSTGSDLEKVRKLTAKLDLNVSGYIRKVRDDEANAH